VKLLDIQSSPRGQSSDSITLTKSFIEACKSNDTSIVVDTLNVWQERLRQHKQSCEQCNADLAHSARVYHSPHYALR
jgi:FMN-dependent NADH-azoreductase